MTSKSQAKKKKDINKEVKKTTYKKKKTTYRRNNFQIYLIRVLIFRIYKEFLQLNSKDNSI